MAAQGDQVGGGGGSGGPGGEVVEVGAAGGVAAAGEAAGAVAGANQVGERGGGGVRVAADAGDGAAVGSTLTRRQLPAVVRRRAIEAGIGPCPVSSPGWSLNPRAVAAGTVTCTSARSRTGWRGSGAGGGVAWRTAATSASARRASMLRSSLLRSVVRWGWREGPVDVGVDGGGGVGGEQRPQPGHPVGERADGDLPARRRPGCAGPRRRPGQPPAPPWPAPRAAARRCAGRRRAAPGLRPRRPARHPTR